MRRWAGVWVAAVLLAGGCGDDASPGEQALAEAADATAGVRAGELRLKVAATPATGEGDVGFEVAGPFRLATEAGALPEVQFTYTELWGGRSRQQVFSSTADGARVTVDGTATAVPDDALAHLRGRAEDSDEGLPRLALDEWAERPRIEGGQVTGEVDVATALSGVVALAAAVGAEPRDVPRLEGADAERLAQAVRSSRFHATIGDDDVLRRLRMEIRFGATQQDAVADALGRLAGVVLVVEVDLDPAAR